MSHLWAVPHFSAKSSLIFRAVSLSFFTAVLRLIGLEGRRRDAVTDLNNIPSTTASACVACVAVVVCVMTLCAVFVVVTYVSPTHTGVTVVGTYVY